MGVFGGDGLIFFFLILRCYIKLLLFGVFFFNNCGMFMFVFVFVIEVNLLELSFRLWFGIL